MFDRAKLKTRAKSVMSRHFLTMFFACLIVSLISGGIATFSNRFQNIDFANLDPMRIAIILGAIGLLLIISILFSIFVISPLTVGLKYFMLRTADGDSRIENLLYPFKNGYKNIVYTMFMKNLYIFLWSLVGGLPLGLILGFSGIYSKIMMLATTFTATESISSALSLMSIMSSIFVVAVICSIPAIIKTLQYSMTEYILADNPNMKKSDVLSKSKEMMVGNKWSYIILRLSFLGWELLAFFCCCIGSTILQPYIESTFTELYLELSGQGKDYESFSFNNGFNY